MKSNGTTAHEDKIENVSSHKFCKTMKLTALIATYQKITGVLDSFNDKLPRLLLRLILALEFWEAGMMKLDGENWFDQLTFPFPFSLFSNDSLWAMGTWLEIIGAIALVVGFGTRLFALGMMILTVVAVNTVHWPAEWHSLAELSKGYAITDSGHGNFKLPLIYFIMFMPLLFGGAGKWSLDYLLKRLYCHSGLYQNN
jgi:putative oxidoreductase